MRVKDRLYRDVEKLARDLDEKRRRGARVVLANGCFDILHVGHVRYLEEAAALGDLLVVAVNDDDSTRGLKGDGRPVMPGEERAELLLALRCVDRCLLFGAPTVDEIIRILRPDIHAKGTDYTVDTVPEIESARAVGTRTVITGDRKSHASRDVIRKVRGDGRS
ncbi:MAG: adenylyltransferase/cytidyltransferase family protein [Candidatus Krumholzibacteriota bacterium]|nr:adenylyltransferase/cytidyltransferase family protein [Candidatus Krumholzibacteriota bacterium]